LGIGAFFIPPLMQLEEQGRALAERNGQARPKEQAELAQG